MKNEKAEDSPTLKAMPTVLWKKVEWWKINMISKSCKRTDRRSGNQKTWKETQKGKETQLWRYFKR